MSFTWQRSTREMALLNLFNKLCIYSHSQKAFGNKNVSSTCFTESLIIKKNDAILFAQFNRYFEIQSQLEELRTLYFLHDYVKLVATTNHGKERKLINHAVLYEPHNGSILSTMLQHTLISEVSPLTFLGFSRFAKLRVEQVIRER